MNKVEKLAKVFVQRFINRIRREGRELDIEIFHFSDDPGLRRDGERYGIYGKLFYKNDERIGMAVDIEQKLFKPYTDEDLLAMSNIYMRQYMYDKSTNFLTEEEMDKILNEEIE